ncbi:MAG: T9SS type A sorting domain-containing protein, partial [Bacteroidetes bacterium]|nr:T9SS type A sorting domain-containing protein [Bacteroidota bacterium]
SVVALGIKAGVAGAYHLDVSGIENFFCAKSIILEDLKTGARQDLTGNPSYSFSASPGEARERFHIHFSGPFGMNNEGAQPGFSIYSFNHSVYINNLTGKLVNGEVTICNILGQKIVQQRITDQTTVIGINAPAGCYLVTLVTPGQTCSKKVFIRW